MRYLLPLVSLCFCLNATAQTTYRAYFIKGQAEHFVYSNKIWKPLDKGSTLKLADSLRVYNDDSVKIVDSGTGVVYVCPKGCASIKEIIDLKNGKNNSTIRAVNKELLAESKRKGNPERIVVYGGTSRGDEKIGDSYESSLARTLKDGSFKYLSVNIKTEDGVSYLSLRNDSGTSLVVNIVAISRDIVAAKVVLPSSEDGGLYVLPGETDLDFVEVFPSDIAMYLAFPVTQAFDARAFARNVEKEFSVNQ